MNSMESLRLRMDETDKRMLDLFLERMDIVTQIAELKYQNHSEISCHEREDTMKEVLYRYVPDSYIPYYEDFICNVIDISKNYQYKLFEEKDDEKYSNNQG